jgi:hypothetical protein
MFGILKIKYYLTYKLAVIASAAKQSVERKQTVFQ